MATINFDDDTELSVFVEENAAQAQLVFSLQSRTAAAVAQNIISRFEDSGADAEAIITALLNDFDQGGPIFNGLRSQFKSSIRNGADYVADKVSRDVGVLASGETNPEEELQMWQSVLSKNTCPTCAKNHGTVNTAAGWAGIGPREAPTECGENCKCELVPVSVIRKSLNARNNAEVIADARKDARLWEKQIKDKTSPLYRENRTKTRQDKDQGTAYNSIVKQANAERRAEKQLSLFAENMKDI